MRRFITILALMAVTMGAAAATVENSFFKVTTLDDSWFLTNDDALRPYGARVDVARMDARGATLELARIDYIEGAFDPLLYLQHQVVEKKDVFCRSASNFTQIYSTVMAGYDAQCVQFKKTSNNYNYDCEAVTFNVGYGTVLVIMAHREGNPSLIGRVVDGISFKVDTTPITTSQQFVDAASKVVAQHHLPIGNNEHLCGVEMSPDSSTVTLKVTVPYITKENINVPAFVMSKRDAWFKQAPEALKFNLLLAKVTDERKNLRYHYVDTKGNEIGTLLIMPEEYDQVDEQSLAIKKAEQLQKEARAKAEALAKAQAQEEAMLQEEANAEQEIEKAKQEVEKAVEEAKQEVEKAVVAQQSTTTTYVVKSGDNLSKIAKQHGVSVASIRNANPSIKNDQINIGQKLIIKKAVPERSQEAVKAEEKPMTQDQKAVSQVSENNTSEQSITYVVKSGDTLSKIASKHGVSVASIRKANPKIKNDKINIGQKLTIPRPAN